eukprot:NODE_4460_length_578_cov_5753.079395_g2654_i5.p2 GENE.NODE_4460_length_578_cov_5753.079395_g2654_i5~~NODE_4460_length_578_cov_5753.079395_g2654_i5.p2  ORF type:complete len:79 (+),score=30.88 NODE_4460_length_578_cov_5753.079395_g2654_i5:206-442(+)
MGRLKITRRSRIHPFLMVCNHKHILPTRYSIALGAEFKGKISLSDPTKRKASKAIVRQVFQRRYYAGKNKWFFQKLKF